eukprot:NODE_7883_length_381_cov_109.740964_g6175_i0.p2 GENE.NODE_7883_length_381_cov_109.740964_g6175_i0~~NODE_7883_length_381_cov_109.740964_g6175_i0.p2  ORF type:complete len:105 (-),score=6.68 NODE_7883_length_381_cov_109.740964_g6175_i0:66-353(-)
MASHKKKTVRKSLRQRRAAQYCKRKERTKRARAYRRAYKAMKQGTHKNTRTSTDTNTHPHRTYAHTDEHSGATGGQGKRVEGCFAGNRGKRAGLG